MLRKQTNANDPRDWFAFAEDRLKAADLIWAGEGLTHAGVECLQEAMERYLKGFLVSHGWKLIKTHDLTHLVAEASKTDRFFDSYVELAEQLTEQFFLQHYPGLDTTGVGENYEDMRTQVGEIVSHLKVVLPQFF
jgi:HEPN domain-containing protein